MNKREGTKEKGSSLRAKMGILMCFIFQSSFFPHIISYKCVDKHCEGGSDIITLIYTHIYSEGLLLCDSFCYTMSRGIFHF